MRWKALINKCTHLVGYQLVQHATLERLVEASTAYKGAFVTHIDVMGLLPQLHDVNWPACTGDMREKMKELVALVLRYETFREDDLNFSPEKAGGYIPDDMDLELYCPYFFKDKEVVAALIAELQLERAANIFKILDASGRYAEDANPWILRHKNSLDLKLFHAYRHLAMRVYHRGEGHTIPRIGERFFETQKRLRAQMPTPSKALSQLLERLEIKLSDLRLILPEWTVLIGHQGHLNIHLLMRDMGWWQGTPVILAKKGSIANHTFLSLFNDRCLVLIEDQNISSDLWLELASLAPFSSVNMQLFTFENDNNKTMYWCDAGALAIREWEQQGGGFPMRDTYDKHPSFEATDVIFNKARTKWGMSSSDWYVCLHMRDSQSRGEASDVGGEAVRNTSFENYIEAVRFITAQGGWVVRMGSSHAPHVPDMPRLIDYAHSAEKSEAMDIHLVRKARFFIGTTSGFLYTASSFGIPIALVNAISCIGWILPQNTRFIPKKVYDKTGRLLTQRELTSEEWRWKWPTYEATNKAGLTVEENSADEILETVKEVFALTLSQGSAVPSPLLERWRDALSLPYFYGSATPCHYFLEKHAKDFLGVTSVKHKKVAELA